jgi:hypothetical protein
LAALIGGIRSARGTALALIAAGLVAGGLMIAAEFSPIATVNVTGQGDCQLVANPTERDRCKLSGFERHGGALIVLGLATVVMTVGAALGRSRPAALALLAIGAVVVILLALLLDLPKTDEVGLLSNFEGARGEKGAGFWLELVGGILAALTGLAALLRRPELR